ncbi:MAG: alpha-E domain-containing protein [Candidatus Thiodiazotropha lotti]|uniref:alpha-E domain-containing protein n=1 Tax=Candidatus Thiodiazotropha endoloripes TaxID=1818881 RepID=UPI00083D61CA|nr:alpha-E domain-containing protein [Candidatus Thiodiazotropha endoloripes]MCG7902607.1 alpha-E domain-containing protein [Candidatus Thiodiazotropha weberae]MCG7990383.1 alpha-E domain-containing protein [Candidatus Thiodiazotropha lotti]MCG7913481.1 alpha-E domain-containing protein [Candidatus Thiodiazotropha weberae]MCG7999760.1 alpha-E domain-containing protein [Candidatus Thiodiazotropha lotti]MCW4182037.1 alpha-E domain-containing protein [Candidatus Thiodiazotropha weberae]
MLSRVAQTIYWIGRYQERAENTARLITVNTNLMLDLPPKVAPGWDALINLLGCYDSYLARHPEFTERRVANFLINDESNSSSIISTLCALRENARTIREILPREAWESINSYYQTALERKQSSFSRQGRQTYLEHIIAGSQLMTGLLAGSMNHDTAYRFLNLGRKLERADMTTRIIDVRPENPLPEEAPELAPFEDIQWMSMLKSLSAYQMYRQHMQVRINRKDVLQFLFKTQGFPRSISYCTENIRFNLSRLPKNRTPLKVLKKIDTRLTEMLTDKMDNNELHEFIDDLQIDFGTLHEAISKAYFPPALMSAA